MNLLQEVVSLVVDFIHKNFFHLLRGEDRVSWKKYKDLIRWEWLKDFDSLRIEKLIECLEYIVVHVTVWQTFFVQDTLDSSFHLR